ncbi:hypothetical protein [Saccharomonospora iraqiensis]|uniref:hypothetical protein n=1 Tax=Saccharomonospora iraqiensis TaxID=52698 RepID=UPI000428623C|nr:hypothetical protein [Saccharomonospora iraqiensis]
MSTTHAVPLPAAPPTPVLHTPPTAEQIEALTRILVEDRDPHRAAVLLHAVSHRTGAWSGEHGGDDADPERAAIRALRRPPQDDLPAALLRIARAIDAETEVFYHRQDLGHTDADPALRSIAFRVLELGFTIAGHGGVDARAIERTVAEAFDLPGHRPA